MPCTENLNVTIRKFSGTNSRKSRYINGEPRQKYQVDVRFDGRFAWYGADAISITLITQSYTWTKHLFTGEEYVSFEHWSDPGNLTEKETSLRFQELKLDESPGLPPSLLEERAAEEGLIEIMIQRCTTQGLDYVPIPGKVHGRVFWFHYRYRTRHHLQRLRLIKDEKTTFKAKWLNRQSEKRKSEPIRPSSSNGTGLLSLETLNAATAQNLNKNGVQIGERPSLAVKNRAAARPVRSSSALPHSHLKRGRGWSPPRIEEAHKRMKIEEDAETEGLVNSIARLSNSAQHNSTPRAPQLTPPQITNPPAVLATPAPSPPAPRPRNSTARTTPVSASSTLQTPFLQPINNPFARMSEYEVRLHLHLRDIQKSRPSSLPETDPISKYDEGDVYLKLQWIEHEESKKLSEHEKSKNEVRAVAQKTEDMDN